MKKVTVRATFSATAQENARMPDTPMVSAWSFVVKHGGELREAVCIRTYYAQRGTGMQPIRACVWIRPAEKNANYRSGKGSAGGCGYHKESQAIEEAFSSAGVSFYGRAPWSRDESRVDWKKRFYFGGTGGSGYRDVFEAVARAAGYRIRPGSSILVSH
jgi:hypothetical protein